MSLSPDIIQKFRDEYVASLPSVLERASRVSLAQRWDALFQCSIAPKKEFLSPDHLSSLLEVYQVSTLEQLIPKYLGEDPHWGALVSPRVSTTTGEPIAFVDQWFASDPDGLESLIETIGARWPFPFAAIWISLSPRHRWASCLAEWKAARLEECAYVGDWSQSQVRPEPISALKFSQFSCSMNQEIDVWWPDFIQELNRDGSVLKSNREVTSLRKGMEGCLQTGGILHLQDDRGLAAFISWFQGSEAELLLPQCWTIPCIFVRSDLRGQGLAKHLYGLASQKMRLDDIPFICARVQFENHPSWNALESVGAERVMEYYQIG